MNKIVKYTLCALVSAFVSHGALAMMPDSSTLPAIDTATLEQRLSSATPPVLIDVREGSEFEAGHIPGATLIPLGSLPDRIAEVPKDKPVVVICRSGHRSGRAAAFLASQGYKNVENLTGGMMAWSEKCASNKNHC